MLVAEMEVRYSTEPFDNELEEIYHMVDELAKLKLKLKESMDTLEVHVE